jgi:F-type H+-transporting ATPase subunit delta
MAELNALYAAALFELAVEAGAEEDFLAQATVIRDALGDEGCRRVLAHPHITPAEKRNFLDQAFSGRVHSHLLNFMYLVIDKNREPYLVPALSSLIGLIENRQRKTTANVITAAELSAEQAEALKQMLSKKLDKQVELSTKIDPAVIGGLYILVDGYLIDRTVKTQLNQLTVSMREGDGA